MPDETISPDETTSPEGMISTDSCAALDSLRADVDAFMADLLDAALAVKAEQGLGDNAEAFDYTVSFLSGVYRAMALIARDSTIEAMG